MCIRDRHKAETKIFRKQTVQVLKTETSKPHYEVFKCTDGCNFAEITTQIGSQVEACKRSSKRHNSVVGFTHSSGHV